MGLKSFFKKIGFNKKLPENKPEIVRKETTNENGSKDYSYSIKGSEDISLNISVSFGGKSVQEKERVYLGKNKYGSYDYEYIDSEGKKHKVSTSESPEKYELRKKIDDAKVKHKGKEYGDKELEKIHSELSENYIPVHERKKSIEEKFSPFENLTTQEKEEISHWKKKMEASSWKSRQRSLRRKGKLKDYQVEMLNKLGMLWNPTTDDWEKKLIIFKSTGFCDEIEDWVHEQRQLYNNKNLSEENFFRLQAANFPFISEEDERFPFTWNSYYALREKLERKRKRIRNKNKKPVTSREKKEKEKWRIRNNKIQRFYNGFHGLPYKFENKLPSLSYDELKNLILKVYDGESMYYESYQSFFKNIKESEIYKLIGSHTFNEYKDRVEKNIEIELRYRELLSFNSSKINDEIREFACLKMLDLFENITEFKTKSFPPLKYLISYYTKQKNVDKINELKSFVNRFPLLKELYSEQIDNSLKKSLKP